jgi:hypothetical protein
MGKKKTKVKWLIKCLKTNLNKDQEKMITQFYKIKLKIES